MLILTGAPALSDFRLAKHLAAIRARVPAVTALDSRYVHFADLARPLSPAERAVLESLLTYGPASARGEPERESPALLTRSGTSQAMIALANAGD